MQIGELPGPEFKVASLASDGDVQYKYKKSIKLHKNNLNPIPVLPENYNIFNSYIMSIVNNMYENFGSNICTVHLPVIK